MNAGTVKDYETGETLDGEPSLELVTRSLAEPYGTGAVLAYRDTDGVWQYLADSQESIARGQWGLSPVIVWIEQ